jgi:hypothetical protein
MRKKEISIMNSNYSIIISRHIIRNAILIILILFTSFTITSGQEARQQTTPPGPKIRQKTPPLRERIFFGGSFGLQFGTITNIEVAPIIGLWVLPRVAIGAGPEYIYYRDPYFKTSIYGGKIYSELVLIQDFNNIVPLGAHFGLFLHAEYETLSLESAVWNPAYTSARFQINSLLGGGGISQQIGRRASVNFMALWVLNSSGYDYYSNPEIRISFNF